MNAKDRVRAKIARDKSAANRCSDRVVASKRMCYGCHNDIYCNVSAKFKAAKRKRRY